MKKDLLRRLVAAKQRPDLVKPLTQDEVTHVMADLVAFVQQINATIEANKIVGPTGKKGPKGEKGAKGDKGDKGERGPSGIPGAPGKDAIVGQDLIEDLAERAAELIDLPNIKELLENNPEIIKDCLDSLDERYNPDIEDVTNLATKLSSLEELIKRKNANSSGGIGKPGVVAFVNQAIAEGQISTGGSIRISEEDGTPSVSPVTEIKFSNGTVTNNGDGTVSVSNTGGGGVSAGKLTDKGNVTGATTITWNDADYQKITLTGNTTLTFTAPTITSGYVKRLQLHVVQDATGSRTLTFPTIKTPGGSGITVSAAANAEDIITFYFNGTDYYGVDTLNFS